jgi:hypothetical protein
MCRTGQRDEIGERLTPESHGVDVSVALVTLSAKHTSGVTALSPACMNAFQGRNLAGGDAAPATGSGPAQAFRTSILRQVLFARLR